MIIPLVDKCMQTSVYTRQKDVVQAEQVRIRHIVKQDFLLQVVEQIFVFGNDNSSNVNPKSLDSLVVHAGANNNAVSV